MTPKAEFRRPYDDPTWLSVSQFGPNPGFRFEQWLNHLLYIFNQRRVRKIGFNGAPSIQRLLNLRRTFEKFETLSIYSRCPDHTVKNVLSKFRPEKTLWIDKHVPDIDNFITTNLDTIHLKTILELDQLLIVNGKLIMVQTPKFSSRDINRFLKLWIAGSNRNLVAIFIQFEAPTDLEMNQVIKGVSHEKVPNDVRREFPDWRNPGLSWVVNGGIDIRRRRDGAIATIEYVENNRVFSMLVWRS
ncbi:hypothetical protein B9Z55_011760 [Caenorhabditis nigoni]|uniref:Sdz-33 F-box domain-containing protein n=1 Tax=Caenorhabditis nigoni TaxID=1611254 RepID=A0A2G5ULL6_9PELO|nr:hypothetical protein B9Z55_011760 [Caenorhabditis nigoni]